jgi:hypothetical protein
MYTPNRVAVYPYVTFPIPPDGGAAHSVTLDVTAYGYPAEATAVELFVGCRSWVDGAYVAAYDGVTGGLDRTALYVTAPIRNQWTFSRGRVELDGSSFLLWIRPVNEPIEVIAVLKGYYT